MGMGTNARTNITIITAAGVIINPFGPHGVAGEIGEIKIVVVDVRPIR